MGKNKRPKNYYIQMAKRQKTHHGVLKPGLTGFLCTCNDRERECVVEAYDILNEYADQMYGKEEMPDGKCSSQGEIKSLKTEGETEKKVSSEGKEPGLPDGNACAKVVSEEKSSEAAKEDVKEQLGNGRHEAEKGESKIPSQEKTEEVEATSDSEEEFSSLDAAIKADVDELQKGNEKKHRHLRRFGQVATGARNYVFIRSTLEDPLLLSLAIMDDILKQQRQITKKLIRMIPVQATCKAFQDDIVKEVKKLCESYFKEKGESFYIAIKVRNNNSVEKESLKASLITVVSEARSANTPVLNHPGVVVNIDVIKNVCCISFLPEYFTKYCKYNLLSLGNKEETAKIVPKTEDSKDEIPAKEVDSKDEVPVKKVDSKDEVPAKEVDSKDEVPAKEVDSKNEVPAKEVDSKDEVPTKEVEVK